MSVKGEPTNLIFTDDEMDLIKAGADVIKEGTKVARGLRKVGEKWMKGGKAKGSVKKAYASKGNKMMRSSSGRDSEIKRCDLKLDDATACVAIAAVAGNQNFTTGFVATNLIQQGTDDFKRIANKITVFQTMIETELSRDAGDAFVRSMVVFDSSPDGTYPALADIISTVQQAGGTNTGFFSANNVHNTDRFRVLRNKIYTLDTYHPKIHLKYVLKNKYDVQYDGTADPLTIGSVLKGTMYWIWFYSGSAPKITNTYIRCKYTDK